MPDLPAPEASAGAPAPYGQFLDKELVVKVGSYFPSPHLPMAELKAPLNRWLAHSIDLITKESFHGYSSSQLTETEAKVFFGRNLLLNYHELVGFFP